MPKPLGRAVSHIRTPQLVREYLTKLGAEGDYVSHIHQAVKAMLQERAPLYHWPRRHSFQALVGRLLWIGLLEKTGQHQDPEDRGAGVMGTDQGWRQRVWVRLAPGMEDSPAWTNPMGAVVGGQPAPQLEAPAPPPRRGRAREAPEEPVRDLGARVERLERERLALVQRLAAASETAGRVEDFEALHQAARRFLGGVSAVYDSNQFPDSAEAMEQLLNCIRLFEQERALTQRRVQALRNCRTWAGLLADSLGSALAIPRGLAARRPAEGLPETIPGLLATPTPLRRQWLETPAGRRFRELAELGSFGRSPAETREHQRLYQRYLESDMTPAERRAWRKEQREAAAMDVAAEREAAAAERAEAAEESEAEEEGS